MFILIFLLSSLCTLTYSKHQQSLYTNASDQGHTVRIGPTHEKKADVATASPLVTGNIAGDVKVLKYSEDNIQVFARSLIASEDDTAPVNKIFGLGTSAEKFIYVDNTRVNLAHPFRLGEIEIGGPIFEVKRKLKTPNRIVAIGKTSQSMTIGILIEERHINEHGCVLGSWGVIPLKSQQFTGFLGSAQVNMETYDKMVFPIERPTIPSIITVDDSYRTVHRMSILHLMQCNFVNVLSYILQTIPVADNVEIRTTVYYLYTNLVLRQINVEILLPILPTIMKMNFKDQLTISLNTIAQVVDSEFRIELLKLIAFFDRKECDTLIFSTIIPNLTAGIYIEWVTPYVTKSPKYEPGNVESFVNYVLLNLVHIVRDSSDIHQFKYCIYLLFTHLPMQDMSLNTQVRSLAVLLLSLDDEAWYRVKVRLAIVPLINCYDFSIRILQELSTCQCIPNDYVELIIVIIRFMNTPSHTKKPPVFISESATKPVISTPTSTYNMTQNKPFITPMSSSSSTENSVSGVTQVLNTSHGISTQSSPPGVTQVLNTSHGMSTPSKPPGVTQVLNTTHGISTQSSPPGVTQVLHTSHGMSTPSKPPGVTQLLSTTHGISTPSKQPHPTLSVNDTAESKKTTEHSSQPYSTSPNRTIYSSTTKSSHTKGQYTPSETTTETTNHSNRTSSGELIPTFIITTTTDVLNNVTRVTTTTNKYSQSSVREFTKEELTRKPENTSIPSISNSTTLYFNSITITREKTPTNKYSESSISQLFTNEELNRGPKNTSTPSISYSATPYFHYTTVTREITPTNKYSKSSTSEFTKELTRKPENTSIPSISYSATPYFHSTTGPRETTLTNNYPKSSISEFTKEELTRGHENASVPSISYSATPYSQSTKLEFTTGNPKNSPVRNIPSSTPLNPNFTKENVSTEYLEKSPIPSMSYSTLRYPDSNIEAITTEAPAQTYNPTIFYSISQYSEFTAKQFTNEGPQQTSIASVSNSIPQYPVSTTEDFITEGHEQTSIPNNSDSISQYPDSTKIEFNNEVSEQTSIPSNSDSISKYPVSTTEDFITEGHEQTSIPNNSDSISQYPDSTNEEIATVIPEMTSLPSTPSYLDFSTGEVSNEGPEKSSFQVTSHPSSPFSEQGRVVVTTGITEEPFSPTRSALPIIISTKDVSSGITEKPPPSTRYTIQYDIEPTEDISSHSSENLSDPMSFHPTSEYVSPFTISTAYRDNSVITKEGTSSNYIDSWKYTSPVYSTDKAFSSNAKLTRIRSNFYSTTPSIRTTTTNDSTVPSILNSTHSSELHTSSFATLVGVTTDDTTVVPTFSHSSNFSLDHTKTSLISSIEQVTTKKASDAAIPSYSYTVPQFFSTADEHVKPSFGSGLLNNSRSTTESGSISSTVRSSSTTARLTRSSSTIPGSSDPSSTITQMPFSSISSLIPSSFSTPKPCVNISITPGPCIIDIPKNASKLILMFPPLNGIFEACLDIYFRNPYDLLPACSVFEGCEIIEKIRIILLRKETVQLVQGIENHYEHCSSKASLLLFILEIVQNEFSFDCEVLIAMKYYIEYLKTIVYVSQISTNVYVKCLIPVCYGEPVCSVFHQVRLIFDSSVVTDFVTSLDLSITSFDSPVEYFHAVVEQVINSHIVNGSQKQFFQLFLHLSRYSKQHSVISSLSPKLVNTLHQIFVIQTPRDERLFNVAMTWLLKKENLHRIVAGIENIHSLSLNDLMRKLLFRHLVSSEIISNKILHEAIQHLLNKLVCNKSWRTINTNASELLHAMGIPLSNLNAFDGNLFSVLRAIDGDHLGEVGKSMLINFFRSETQKVAEALNDGFPHWKYKSKGKWLKAFIIHLLKTQTLKPVHRSILYRVIPFIRMTGIGAEPLDCKNRKASRT